MELTDSQISAAKDELNKDKRLFFCIDCGRPRSKVYCPWNAKHPKAQLKHIVVERKLLKPTDQLKMFLSNRHEVTTKHVFKEG